MRTTQRTAEQVQAQHGPVAPIVLSVVGSLAGTLVAYALSKSAAAAPISRAAVEQLTLLGAALGAAIPPMIAAAGSYFRLRMAAGILIAAGALLATYAVITVPQTALAKEPIFPVPQGWEPSLENPPHPGQPGKVCEQSLCITVTPKELHCSADACDSAVVVENSGAKLLRVREIEIKGDDSHRFTRDDGCEFQNLSTGESCSIAINIRPGAQERAKLVIHQNLKGPPTVVELEADPSSLAGPDLLLASVPECEVDANTLTVHFEVRASGVDTKQTQVRLASGTGIAASRTITLDDDSKVSSISVNLDPDDYEAPHAFTLTVDSKQQIGETDESNNSAMLTVNLPPRPEEVTSVACQ
jgi:hypothetical protein